MDFKDKVAVITGAASGIGRALAERCAQEGMKVVLADVEESALQKAETEMKAAGSTVLAVVTDVSNAGDMEVLGRKTLDTFGSVHLLCNNAGVGAGSTVWESTINDWKWVLDVNLWGVIHGLRVFLPIMLSQKTAGHVVNTASLAGMVAFHRSAAYHVAKHAVVALSEKLYYDMAVLNAGVGISVLCPGWVKTNIMDGVRNRPAELQDDPSETSTTPEREDALEQYRESVESGMPPDQVAGQVIEAVKEGRFYIFTHPEFRPLMKARCDAILEERNPTDIKEIEAMLNR